MSVHFVVGNAFSNRHVRGAGVGPSAQLRSAFVGRPAVFTGGPEPFSSQIGVKNDGELVLASSALSFLPVTKKKDDISVKHATARPERATGPEPHADILRASDVNSHVHRSAQAAAVEQHDAKRARQAAAGVADGVCQFHVIAAPMGAGKLSFAKLLATSFGVDDSTIVWGGVDAPCVGFRFINIGSRVQALAAADDFDEAAAIACIEALRPARAAVVLIMELASPQRRAKVIRRVQAALKRLKRRPITTLWPFECDRNDVVFWAARGQQQQQLRPLPDYLVLEHYDAFEPVTADEASALGAVIGRGACGAPPFDVVATLDDHVLLALCLRARGDVVEQFGFDVLRSRFTATRPDRIDDRTLWVTGAADALLSTDEGVVVVEFKSTMASVTSPRFDDTLTAWVWQLLTYLFLYRANVGYIVLKKFQPHSPYCDADWTVFRVDGSLLERDFVERICRATGQLPRRERAAEILQRLRVSSCLAAAVDVSDDGGDAVARAFRSPLACDVRLLRAQIGATLQHRARVAQLRVPLTVDELDHFLLRSFFYHEHGVKLARQDGLYFSRDGSLAAHSIAAQVRAWTDMDEDDAAVVTLHHSGRAHAVGCLLPSPLAQAAARHGVDMTRYDRYVRSTAVGALKYDFMAAVGDDFEKLRNAKVSVQIGGVMLLPDEIAKPKGKKGQKKKAAKAPPPPPPPPRQSGRKRKDTADKIASDEQKALFADIPDSGAIDDDDDDAAAAKEKGKSKAKK